LFDHGHTDAGFGQSEGRRESERTAADDRYRT
jgi:hypothetical protein